MSDKIDTIFKALRVVPDFDGNPHVLTRFISLCDRIVITYFDITPGHELENLSLLNGILNKITGPAARLINSQGISDNWNGIRNALINNFADHRDETALYNDMSMQSQGSSTPQEFYERCQKLYSTIVTYITLNESLPTTIEAKRALYKKLTLQCYLRGLKEPLGSRIRCMRPDSMEKALEYVQEELNTLYLQQRNEGGPSKKDWQLNTSFNSNKPFNNSAPHSFNYNPAANMPGPSRQPPVPHHPFPAWRPQINTPVRVQYQGPSRTQRMFSAPPPNYNPQSNAFRVPQRPPPNPQPTFKYGTPKPMSGVSHFSSKPLPPSGHDWRKFGNPPPSNYFKSREMNFNQTYPEQYYYPDSTPDYYQPEYNYGYEQDCYNFNNEYFDHEQNYYPTEPYICYELPQIDENDDSNANSCETENFCKIPKSDKPK